MESEAISPGMDEAREASTKTVARWRWWVHLTLLGLLPLVVGVLGIRQRNRTVAALPSSVKGLLWAAFFELLYPGIAFGIAWWASRASVGQLFLRWRGGVKPVLLGFAYSVALRFAIMFIMMALVVVWMVFAGAHLEGLEHLRAQTEHLVSASALAQDPIYFVLCLTLISFIVAGLREELWRAGMFAGFEALFPRQMSERWGRAVALAVAGVIFGLGHTTQGVAGVGIATFLGVGLGAIMLWHRSIWEAVIAHGFFDASTFAFLCLLAKQHPEMLHNLH